MMDFWGALGRGGSGNFEKFRELEHGGPLEREREREREREQ